MGICVGVVNPEITDQQIPLEETEEERRERERQKRKRNDVIDQQPVNSQYSDLELTEMQPTSGVLEEETYCCFCCECDESDYNYSGGGYDDREDYNMHSRDNDCVDCWGGGDCGGDCDGGDYGGDYGYGDDGGGGDCGGDGGGGDGGGDGGGGD